MYEKGVIMSFSKISSKISREITPSKFIISIDNEKCTGCRSCELACSISHEGISSPTLSRLSILRDFISGENSIEICKQCEGPECMLACPVEDAMFIDEKTGARIINEEKCIACGNCARACPFNENDSIIKYNPNKNVYIKCDLCYLRKDGPVCVQICPYGALSYVSHR